MGKLPIYMKLKPFTLLDLLMAFDATSLHPSAMWDVKPKYPKIETGYVFTSDMSDEMSETFNTQTFTQGSAFLKVLCYNSEDIKFQHSLVIEKVQKHRDI